MNIFGASGPSPAELQRQSAIKSCITENLQLALKQLQREHVHTEGVIYSGDSTNAVCNVLEAAFLHGLKSSPTQKNFWGLLQKETHRDTIFRLNRLGQITTEIGMCRAWLRLALNEGVLESYLDAILQDQKTLQYYYSRTAYLRDHEQAGIFKTYIQSLMPFQFELSYNSSVLNIWTHTPLMLAGLVAGTSEPTPVLAHTRVNPTPVVTRSASRGEAVETRSKKPSKVAQISGAPVNMTPPDPQQLTQTAIESMRQIRQRRESESSSTGTSQISCPDPVDARQLEPNLAPLRLHSKAIAGSNVESMTDGVRHTSKQFNSDREQLTSGNKAELKGTAVSGDKVVKDRNLRLREKRDVAQEAVVKTLAATEEQELSSASQAKIQKVSDNNQSVALTLEREIFSNQTGEVDRLPYDPASNPFEYSDDLNPFRGGGDVDSKPITGTIKCPTNPFEEEYDGSLNPFGDDDPDPKLEVSNSKTVVKDGAVCTQYESSQNVMQSDIKTTSAGANVIDNTQTVAQESKIKYMFPPLNAEVHNESSTQSDIYTTNQPEPTSSQANPNSTSQFSSTNLTVPSALDSPTSSLASLKHSASFPRLDLGKSPPLRPVLSQAIATGDGVEVAREALSGSLTESSPEGTGADMEAFHKGNSLGTMEGWSSDFDKGEALLSRQLLTSMHAESFDNMLYNYGSSLGPVEVPTMAHVLDGLPDVYSPSASHSSPPNAHTFLQSVADEYEVLPDLAEKRAYLSEQRYQPLLEILGAISFEKGLDFQNYLCKGCTRPIGMFYGKARVCGYDACYYCYECHENEEYYIPARIIYNWDFSKRKVSRHNLHFLDQSADDPLLNVQALNLKLYDHVQEMAEIRNLRIQLRFLKAYLFTCKQSVADEFKKQVWPREYYYDDIHLYSLTDLLQVATGQLCQSLSRIIQTASKHINDCGLCSQKGFVCEICNNQKVIYPFEMDTTFRCDRCSAVYHKKCKTNFMKCPKCERRQQRQCRIGSDSDSTADYAYLGETIPLTSS